MNSGTVTLHWWEAGGNGSAITNYYVQVAQSSGGSYQPAVGCAELGVVLTCTATGFTNDTGYFFKVHAKNGVGEGPNSAAGGPFTPKVQTCPTGGPCSVGDPGPGGGTVFYVAPSQQSWGTYLEAAPEHWAGGPDALDPDQYWCDDFGKWVTTSDAVGVGKPNNGCRLLSARSPTRCPAGNRRRLPVKIMVRRPEFWFRCC